MMKRTTTLAVPAGILATALMVMMASVAWADFASIVLGQFIKLKDGQTLVIAGQIEGFGAQVTWRLDESRCEVVAFDGLEYTVLEDDSFFSGNPAHAAIFTGVILLRQTGARHCKVRAHRGEYVGVNTDQALRPPDLAIRIGAVPIVLTAADHHKAGATNVRAFIPTDSTSRTCLVSLSESNAADNETAVFCGARTFGSENGLSVNILLPSVPPPTALWDVVVYQEGAKRYGTPVFFPGP